MSKREHAKVNGSGETEGSRHKRRREVGESSSDVDITISDGIETKVENGVQNGGSSSEQVKEHGLKLWHAVRDAVKEGRSLSIDFLRKPSKRLYPDYYAVVKQPIALDDIKKQLDNGGYTSLESVKSDFDLLFGNAKQYNLTDSQIFQDAKELMKLVHKAYNKMVPNEEDAENGKTKTPNLNRLMKSRLEKLVSKTGEDSRILSDEFMQLPSKKLWPIYYKEIKRPQCLENVFKHIKRKEYQSSADFAADVELVFSNALAFNQDNTPIWNDAVTLRDYFRQLMSDLPPPHALPEYAKPSNKIKIRPPQVAQPTASSSTSQVAKPELATTSLMLRVPAAHGAKATPQAPTPAPVPPARTPALPVAPVKQPAPSVPQKSTPQLQTQGKAATPQPSIQTVSFINATPSHYPHAAYVPPVATTASATPPILRSSSVINTHSTSHSPAPVVLPPSHQLKSITLRIQPKGRFLTLNKRDGVKNWAMRLAPGETSVLVSNVTFVEEEESSDEEDVDMEKQEEEDGEDMDVDVEADAPSHTRNGRRKGKGRGRGRPPKASTVATKAAQTAVTAKAAKAAKKKVAPKLGEVQLKLNSFVVKEQPEQPGEWSVYLPVGSNIIEIGEAGGMIWKVYAERIADP